MHTTTPPAPTGYAFQIDHVVYDAFKGGHALTLADCWREVEGVGNARIIAPTGRVVLERAGNMSVRSQVPALAAVARVRARLSGSPQPLYRGDLIAGCNAGIV